MAKEKAKIPLIEDALKTFSKEKFLPVYLFFGVDEYTIDAAVKRLEKSFEPIIESDFDKEVIYGLDRSALEITNLASAFPFGSERKLVIVKEFDKVKDKDKFASYINSPASFTTLCLIGSEDTSVNTKEPFPSLIKNGYIFEAKELKGAQLAEWVKAIAKKNGKTISTENAMLMLDISGENKDILDAQLQKIYTFLGEKKEIDHEAITSLSSKLKEYTVFDLTNAIGKKQGALALKIAYNMLDNNIEMGMIIGMLTKYFGQLARIGEFEKERKDKNIAARAIGTHPFYYDDYVAAWKRFSPKQLLNAVRATFNADMAVKTSQSDNKTIITILLSEILSK